jgi:hypothetical protein
MDMLYTKTVMGIDPEWVSIVIGGNYTPEQPELENHVTLVRMDGQRAVASVSCNLDEVEKAIKEYRRMKR